MFFQKSRIGGWIEQLANALGAGEREDLVLFGSAAIVLHGIDLGRSINDLDVFASANRFASLGVRFGIRTRPAEEGGEIDFITPVAGAEIEILRTIPGMGFETAFANSRPLEAAAGFRVGSLPDLRLWKTIQARPKDLRDVAAIDRYLAARPENQH